MSYFELKKIKLPNKEFQVVKCIIDVNSELFLKVKLQAELKSKFTMDASQSGAYRSQKVKYESQLRGCLSEEYAKLLIERYSEKNNLKLKVERYDNVRTDGFKSPKGEYDIKIISGSNEKLLEARSSIAHDRSLSKAILDFDVIGPYSSIAKQNESRNDFYIRPLYEYLDYVKRDFYRHNLEDLLKEGKVFLYFVGGTDYEQLMKYGYDKSMNQGGTNYRVIKIINGYSIGLFLKKIGLS